MKLAVIGGGASGIAAALQAAWHGAAVTLYEHNAEVGKKILVTGSGRCNITNAAVSAAKYACADLTWMETLLDCFGVRDLIAMLESIGIPVTSTEDGWYYPLSYSARSVVEALTSALALAGVAVSGPSHVGAIRQRDKGFEVDFSHLDRQDEAAFDRVIVSAGGTAYPTLGSRGDLFPTLKELGHTVLRPRPALAPILADLGGLRALQGVRLNVGTSLWRGGTCLGSAKGNLIFTKWGVNGPAAMDISHHVSANSDAALELSLNLLVFFEPDFDRLLAEKRHSAMPVRVFLGAFFPPKVVTAYLSLAGLGEETLLRQVDDRTLSQLTHLLKDTRLPVQGVRGFEYCQVSAGGVPVNEVHPCTLESRLVPGLYLTGETLDVVGPCGGYNLQYAFGSGALAGKAAATFAEG